ncbi:MAG: ABC transporter permease [Desulfovibrio sp.]|jgi:ABC-2 type transport system permease protein|nr:ABC transporter permease [Desulfovibrio sp.]
MSRRAENIFLISRRMLAIARKELLVLFCNRIARILLIVPPLVQIVIFGWAATMEVRNVDVAVLNHDNGRWSREVIHRLQGSPTFRSVRLLPGEHALRPAMERQDVLLALVFDTRFSRRIEAGLEADFQIILDGRRSNAAQIAAYYLGGIVDEISLSTPRAAAGAKTGGGAPPLDVRLRCWFNPNLEFQWYFLPNLIGMLGFMIGLVVTGLTVAREREVGTFDQLLVSPAAPTEIALAKLVPGCLISLVHGTVFLLIAVFGFGVPFTGSIPLLYLAMLAFAAASGGLGLLVSSLSSTQQQAFLGAFTVGVPSILISGAVTPIHNMPAFLQQASQLNPLRHFIVICQGVFLKDITPAAAAVNLGKIFVISLVAVTVAVWIFKRKA